MTTIKRSALALSAATLLTLSLSACGGGASSAPTDASKADFCKVYHSGDDAFVKIGDNDYDAAAKLMHSMSDKLKDVGTPSDIPSDARKGFEVMVKAAGDVDASKMEDASKKMQDAVKSGDTSMSEDDMVKDMFGISSDDVAKVNTFTQWAQDAC